MRKALVLIVVSLGLVAMLGPAADVAADPRGHGRGAGRLGPGHHRAPSFHKHGVERHRFFPRHFSTFGVFVAPPVVLYTAPPVAFSTPLSAGAIYAPPPPVVYSPPSLMLSPPPVAQPAPPPMPRVVEHPTGRYELRGDGIATPYTWVWIPNPPPAPPPPSPPAGAPTSGDALPAREQVYQWVDEQGVAHWTNRVDRIPRRYREEASR